MLCVEKKTMGAIAPDLIAFSHMRFFLQIHVDGKTLENQTYVRQPFNTFKNVCLPLRPLAGQVIISQIGYMFFHLS